MDEIEKALNDFKHSISTTEQSLEKTKKFIEDEEKELKTSERIIYKQKELADEEQSLKVKIHLEKYRQSAVLCKEKEDEVKKIEGKIAETNEKESLKEEKMRRIRKEIEKLQQSIPQKIRERDSQNELMVNLTNKRSKETEKLSRINLDISSVKQTISGLVKDKTNCEKRKKEYSAANKIEELKHKIKEMEQSIKATKKTKERDERQLSELTPSLDELKKQKEKADDDYKVKLAERSRAEMEMEKIRRRSSNDQPTLDGFTEQIRQKINSLKSRNYFEDDVIGPLVYYVHFKSELKFAAPVIQEHIKKIMKSFLVFNSQDKAKLQQIASQFSGTRSNPISILMQSKTSSIYRIAQHPDGITTIFDCIDLVKTDPNVINAMINFTSIEHVFIAKKVDIVNEKLRKFAPQGYSMGYSLDNYRSQLRGDSFSTFRFILRPSMFPDTDIEEEKKRLENVYIEARNTCNNSKMTLTRITSSFNAIGTKISSLTSNIKKASSRIESMEEELQKLKDTNLEESNEVVDQLDAEIKNYEANIATEERKMLRHQEEKATVTGEINSITNQLEETKIKYFSFFSEIKDIEKRITNAKAEEKELMKTDFNFARDRLEESLKSKHSELNELYKEKDNIVSLYFEKEPTEMPPAMQLQALKERRKALKRQREEDHGSHAETFFEDFQNKKKKNEERKVDLAKDQENLIEMKSIFAEREAMFTDVKEETKKRVEEEFIEINANRNFSSTLDINYEDRTLSKKVSFFFFLFPF